MKKIRLVGTGILCLICVMGFLTVMATAGSYALSLKGYRTEVSEKLLRNVSVDIRYLSRNALREKYPPKQSMLEAYEGFVLNVEHTIENFCTTSFPGSASVKRIVDGYRTRFMRSDMGTGEASGGITYAEKAYEYVADFSEYLSSQDIGFVYMQLPGGARITAASGGEAPSATELDAPNEFAKLVEDSDIHFVHMGDDLEALRGFSLDASGHWMPEDALYAAGMLAGALNTQQNYEFRADTFDQSRCLNAMDANRELAEEIKQAYGYGYKLLVPAGDTAYLVTIDEEEILEGGFEETLLLDPSQWKGAQEPAIAYHNTWRINNSTLVDIRNLSAEENADKRILVLGDSFSWPVTAYLSQGVGEIVAMHPRYFVGNVRAYIESYRPDTVVMCYYEGQVGKEAEANFGCLA